MLHVQTNLCFFYIPFLLDNCFDAAFFFPRPSSGGETSGRKHDAMLTASHNSIRKSGSENLVATCGNHIFSLATKSERLQRNQFVNLKCWQLGSWCHMNWGTSCLCVDFYWAWNPWNPWNLASAVWVSLGWICLLMFCFRWRYVYNLTNVHYNLRYVYMYIHCRVWSALLS